MRLISLSYIDSEGTPQEWRLEELELGERNLVVGRNASGKTRVLSLIGGLARHISGALGPGINASMSATFDYGGTPYHYSFGYRDQRVVHEQVRIGNEVKLERNENGFGSIAFSQISPSMMAFQSDPKSFAAFNRRDSVQHEFLEPLAKWAEEVRSYPFSGALGKENLLLLIPDGPAADDTNPAQTSALFRAGRKEFGPEYVEAVKADMRELDYDVTDIDLGTPHSVVIEGAPAPPNSLLIREGDHSSVVDQFAMSTGMYRLMAVLINIHLAIRRKSASTIVIDDIGEGLDYERSLAFIQLIRQRCIDSNIQLIMSTNDKFVMNSVPLDEWIVLIRRGNRICSITERNESELFQGFKFTGLSNFNFFEMHNRAPSEHQEG